MNALLAKTTNNPQTTTDSSGDHNLRLADDVSRGYSKCPTAHAKDMRADGLTAAAIMIYTAISDVQRHENGEFFRSNAGLAKDLILHKNTISRSIAELKAKGYLKIWFINGGRRMRALTLVSRGVSAGAEGGKQQRVPYKENNKKKTTQPLCVFSASLSSRDREDGVLWGGALERLAATHGEEAVMRGLSVFDSHDPKTIDNPVGFLTKAIELKWEPAKSKTKKKIEPVYWNESEYMKGCK